MVAAIYRWWQGERLASLLIWLLPALLVVVCFVLAVTGRLLYQTYDEPRLANLVEGIVGPNEYACTIILLHPWAEPLAISANDFDMIRRHFVTDSGPFRYERLAEAPSNAGRSSVVLAAVSLVRETSLASWALLAM